MSNKQTQEVWQNMSKGRVSVLKLDRNGDTRHELIRGGQKFNITSEERQLNMDRAASDELDVFKNGFLTPVRLLEDSDDYTEIAANPNLLGESELEAMFDLHWKQFQAKVEDISNMLTLQRLLEIAESDDVNVTVKQHQTIKSRIAEISPIAQEIESTVEQVGHVRGDRGPSEGRSVTPR